MSRTYSHCSSDVFIHYLMEYTHTQDKELLQLLKQAKGKSNQIIDRLRREQQRNKLKKETYCNTLYKYIIIHYCHVLHHILSHIFSIIYIFLYPHIVYVCFEFLCVKVELAGCPSLLLYPTTLDIILSKVILQLRSLNSFDH